MSGRAGMELRERIAGLMPQAHAELAELVAIRSVADPRQFPPEECTRAAQWVLDHFAQTGLTDLRLEETADGSQAVYGARPSPDPAAPTVLLDAPYDVQPPLDEQAWRTPPFQLTEVDGRWYGRGAADCKGNILMHLVALRALGDQVPVNLKLIVEGSEEQGTGGLRVPPGDGPGPGAGRAGRAPTGGAVGVRVAVEVAPGRRDAGEFTWSG